MDPIPKDLSPSLSSAILHVTILRTISQDILHTKPSLLLTSFLQLQTSGAITHTTTCSSLHKYLRETTRLVLEDKEIDKGDVTIIALIQLQYLKWRQFSLNVSYGIVYTKSILIYVTSLTVE